MSEHFLVATDGEESTRSLVEYIKNRFNSDETVFHVICVADESRVVPHLMAEEAGTGGVDPSTINERLEDQATSISTDATELLEEAGYEATSIVRFGNPGPEICDAAESRDFTEILISRRSHTAVSELLLGSVSQYVIHHASKPVTLVPLNED